MKNRLINSQINNYKTYLMYRRQFMTLAENVFEFVKLPPYIDISYVNKVLLKEGSIAFFYDEIVGLIALPWRNISTLDVYGRPKKIQVFGQNGYSQIMDRDQFVIMYDNNGQYPLWLDILQYAERYAQATRTIDININQQKTPRFWKTRPEEERTLKDIISNVDAYSEVITTYNDINLEDTQLTLAPAPYIADKLNIDREKIYNEFLRLIGVANLTYTKKERQIRDEIAAMQGGTIASRCNRFEPRRKAVELINEKFGTNIEVKYYDNLPTTIEDTEESIYEEERIRYEI